MNSDEILEIACFNLESALLAESAGADRLELCENYKKGGLTPSHFLIHEACQKIKIPLHVIIRPRAGNFIYSDEEITKMREDILFCKENRLQGVVFGVLTNENKIDLSVCKSLIECARPMAVTFHRAIDACKDINSSCRDLINLGVDRVLTSGGSGNAADNIPSLIKLQEEFGKRIKIMPGGGIRSSNLSELRKTNCTEFHSAAIINESEICDSSEVKRLKKLLTGSK